jgi:hypothetical protein
MKYFIVQGLIPETSDGAPHLANESATRRERIRRWRSMTEAKLLHEGEHVFLRRPGLGRLSVLTYNICEALVMVSAPSQRKAYSLALPFRCYLTVYLGFEFSDDEFFLVELTRKPKARGTTRDIASLRRKLWCNPSNLDSVVAALRSGTGLFQPQIRSASAFIAQVLAAPQLVESLVHLERSHCIFRGYMTEHQYQRHYRPERQLESAYLHEKRYFEERTRYDLAFLSAFRALEALLGTVQIHKDKISKRLHAFDEKFRTSFCSTKWISYHEVFSSRRKRWRFDDLISRYLDVRNAVAAHGNPTPPFQLREDQVLELQLLVKNMLYDAAGKPPMPIY